MDGAGLGDLGWSVAAAHGGEVAELVEDLAAGGAADPLREEAPFAVGEGGEAAPNLPLDQPWGRAREAAQHAAGRRARRTS